MSLLVNIVEVFIQPPFGQQCGVSPLSMLLDEVKAKPAIFADFIVGLRGKFKQRIVLFAAKLVSNAILSDVLFHNHIPFLLQNILSAQGFSVHLEYVSTTSA